MRLILLLRLLSLSESVTDRAVGYEQVKGRSRRLHRWKRALVEGENRLQHGREGGDSELRRVKIYTTSNKGRAALGERARLRNPVFLFIAALGLLPLSLALCRFARSPFPASELLDFDSAALTDWTKHFRLLTSVLANSKLPSFHLRSR